MAEDTVQTEVAEPFKAGIREDQVQNAIAFLSHPKVQSSPESTKRQFLERKGLTNEEIVAAFSRMPQQASAAASPDTNLDHSNAASHKLASSSTPSIPQKPFAGRMPVLGPANVGHSTHMQQLPARSIRRGLTWGQLVVSVGVVAAGVYGVQTYCWPYLKRWLSQTTSAKETKEGPSENAEVAKLIAEALQTQTIELKTSIALLKELTASLGLRLENTSSSDTNALRELRSDVRSLMDLLKQVPRVAPNATPQLGYFKPASQSPVAPSDPALERQLLAQTSTGQQRLAASLDTASSTTVSDQPPHPKSYTDILQMLERGETPPNVRTDIVDKPPNPEQIPTNPKLQPRPKPWELSAQEIGPQGDQVSVRSMDEGAAPVAGMQNGGSNPAKGSGSNTWKPPPVPSASITVPTVVAPEGGIDDAHKHADSE